MPSPSAGSGISGGKPRVGQEPVGAGALEPDDALLDALLEESEDEVDEDVEADVDAEDEPESAAVDLPRESVL